MKRVFLACAAIAISSNAGAASLLTNGDFEDPIISDSCCTTTVTPGSIPGWHVTAGDINIVNGTYASSPSGTNLAYNGNQYLDLIGESGGGAIAQSFATTLRQTYRLKFAYSHNLFGGLGSASANYQVGTLGGTVVHSSGNRGNLDWKTFSGDFKGTGSPMTLAFTNTVGDSNAGVFLDGVSISAVPEPSTWAMFILGFGIVGAAARRRRRPVAVTA